MGQTGKALSRSATQLPLTAISLGLQAWERTRGVRDFALRRGNEALQIAAHTPLGRLLPQQVLDDGADEEAASIAADARRATAPSVVKPKPRPEQAAAKPAKKATPARPPEPPAAAKEVGAPGAVTREVEQISGQLHIDAPEDRAELPIPDFDNISLGSLRARLRSLTLEQLVVLREWEQAHAHRLPVITTLDNRIAKLGGGGGGGGGQAYPTESAQVEAAQAERAAEDEGGTLRV
jgi:hypothetical protein